MCVAVYRNKQVNQFQMSVNLCSGAMFTIEQNLFSLFVTG